MRWKHGPLAPVTSGQVATGETFRCCYASDYFSPVPPKHFCKIFIRISILFLKKFNLSQKDFFQKLRC